jgi:phosphate:Na+ symporter
MVMWILFGYSLAFGNDHLVRMRDGICEDNIAASIIIDIISSIERIGDIALNTANSTITVYKDHKVKYLNV